MNLAYVPKQKEDTRLPDAYCMTIFFAGGEEESYEIVQHSIDFDKKVIHFLTEKNNIEWLFMNVPSLEVMRIEFDARLQKILDLKKQKPN